MLKQFLGFLTVLALTRAQDEYPIVETPLGPVMGKTIPTHYGVNVNSFYGIPFGEDTGGENRFSVSIYINQLSVLSKLVSCPLLIQATILSELNVSLTFGETI